MKISVLHLYRRMAVSLLACLLICFPTVGQACSCAYSPLPLSKQVQDFLAQSPAQDHLVFWGKVTHIQTGGGMQADFRVEQWWRTPVDSEVSIKTDSNEAACGYPFKEGQEYVVFASKYKNEWHAGQCSLTTGKNEEMLSILGAGKKPSIFPKRIDPLVMNLVVFVLVLLAMAAAVVVSNRNRSRKPYEL